LNAYFLWVLSLSLLVLWSQINSYRKITDENSYLRVFCTWPKGAFCQACFGHTATCSFALRVFLYPTSSQYFWALWVSCDWGHWLDVAIFLRLLHRSSQPHSAHHSFWSTSRPQVCHLFARSLTFSSSRLLEDTSCYCCIVIEKKVESICHFHSYLEGSINWNGGPNLAGNSRYSLGKNSGSQACFLNLLRYADLWDPLKYLRSLKGGYLALQTFFFSESHATPHCSEGYLSS
jgi:hypothetical protein